MAYGQNLFQGLMNNQSGAPRGLPPTQGQNPNIANIMATLSGGYTGGGGGMAPGRGTIAPTGARATMPTPLGTSGGGNSGPGGILSQLLSMYGGGGGGGLQATQPVDRSGALRTSATPTGAPNLAAQPTPTTSPTESYNQADWQKYGKDQWKGYWEWLATQKGGLPANAILSNYLRDFGAKGFTGLMPFAGISSNLGGATLAQILESQGATDPRLMNQQIAGIQRGTQSQQAGVQGELARRGLGASGLGQALSASVGQAGEGRIADRRAQEAQTIEQRKRDDLGLLMQMILQPATDASAMALGQYNASASRDQQKKAAKASVIGDLLKAFVLCWAAEEVFHNPQDEDAVRVYMANHPELLNAYLISGKDLAYEIKHNESVRRVIVPKFHEFAEVGYDLTA